MKSFLRKIIIISMLTSEAFAGVLGDFQTFTPNTDGLYFISVDSAKVLSKGMFVANGYLSYAQNHLLAYDSLNTMNRVDYKDELSAFDTTIGYSFSNSFQVFFAATSLLSQNPDSNQNQLYYLSEGVHSYRPGIKWQIQKNNDSAWGIMASVDFLNVLDDPYTGRDPSPIPNIQGIWTGSLSKKSTHGVNIGFRKRTPQEEPLVAGASFYPLKDQITFSYGYSYQSSKFTRFIFEMIGCYPLDKGGNKIPLDVSCLEFLGGLRHRFAKNWAGVAGATVEMPGMQTMSPDWRILAGLNYYFSFGGNKEEPDITPPTSLSEEPSTALSDPEPEPILPPDNNQSTEEPKDPSTQFAAAPLEIAPQESQMLTGQTESFSSFGGQPPYTYSILEGKGRLNPQTGEFRAPNQNGTTKIKVTDSEMNESVAVIHIKEPPKPAKIIVLKGVTFKFDSTELTPKSKTIMDKVISTLNTLKIRELIVEGHTDDLGKDEYNEDLSARRASAIKEILQNRLGLSDGQVQSIGYGEARPVVPNSNEANREKNRRVELKVYTQK